MTTAIISKPDASFESRAIPSRGAKGFHAFWRRRVKALPSLGVIQAPADLVPDAKWFYKNRDDFGGRIIYRNEYPKAYVVRLV